MNIFKLVGSVYVDTAKANNSLQKVGGKADGVAKKLGSGLGKAAKIGAGAVAGVGTAAAGAVAGVVGLSSKISEQGDKIDKASQKLGISAEAYQEWEAVLQHSGTSIDAMGAGFKTLSKSIQDGSKSQKEAFTKLGLSQEELANMSTDDAFTAVISKLQGMEEGTERTALATTILGRSGQQLGALLNTSAEDTQKMKDRLHELGGVMSNEAVKDSARFQDSLQDMQTAFDGVKNKVGATFLPMLSDVMDGVSGIFAGDEDGTQKLVGGIEGFISKIGALVPKLGQLATPILTTLTSALIDNLPMLLNTIITVSRDLLLQLSAMLPTLLPIISQTLISLIQSLFNEEFLTAFFTSIMDFLIQVGNMLNELLPTILPQLINAMITLFNLLVANLPQMIELVSQILMAFVNAITVSMPIIIDALPGLIQGVCDALIVCAPMIYRLIPQIISALMLILAQTWPQLLAIVPQLIGSLVNMYKTFIFKELPEIGKDIVAGLWQGFQNAWTTFISNIKDKFSDLPKGVKKVLGIASPSKVFKELGAYTAEGFNVGFDSKFNDSFRDINAKISGAAVKSPNADVYDLLNTYLPNIANQQLLLDGKTLVGGTVSRMDAKMGTINQYAERGVIV